MTIFLKIALYSTLVLTGLTLLAILFSLGSKWLVDNTDEGEAH